MNVWMWDLPEAVRQAAFVPHPDVQAGVPALDLFDAMKIARANAVSHPAFRSAARAGTMISGVIPASGCGVSGQ